MKIQVFGQRGCTDCSATLDLLDENDITYEYYDVHMSEENFTLMKSVIPEGYNTVPMITIDGEFIGGYNQLRQHFT